jgi:hypothetical protein
MTKTKYCDSQCFRARLLVFGVHYQCREPQPQSDRPQRADLHQELRRYENQLRG